MVGCFFSFVHFVQRHDSGKEDICDGVDSESAEEIGGIPVDKQNDDGGGAFSPLDIEFR